MEILGDLERLVATSLYPLRVPIAVGVAAAIAVLVLVAWRRRWDRSLRRHPRATTAAILLALIVGGPVAWYLGSPLFIRTELVEEPSAAAQVVAGGEFRGADEFHFGSGTARIVETSPGRYELRLEAFSVRNGPDLFVYLSPSADGYADGAVELGALKASDGSFAYQLPTGVDPGAFRSAVIWCRQFAVLFAHAPLA